MQNHNTFFWEQQKKGRSRFNLLLLEYGEYFFEDLSVCMYLQKSPGIESALNLEDCFEVQGRLKVCSRSLIFEPNDVKRPVLKYPFKNMVSTVQEIVDIPTSGGFLLFRAGSFFEMKANNKVTPYKLVEVRSGHDEGRAGDISMGGSSSKSNSSSSQNSRKFSNDTGAGVGAEEGPLHIVFALLHSDIKSTVRKIEQLRRIYVENDQVSGVSEQLLLPFIQSASSTAFDSSQLVDFHEKLLLDEAVSVKRVKPLMHNPGLFMVTIARVYFQPSQLNNVGDGMQCIELSKVLKVYCRRYLLRQTGLEFFMNDGSSTLFVFGSRSLRDKIYRILISANITISQEKGGVSYRSGESLDSITRKWQNREISNFDYLKHLNNEADRSVNDLTQYPVFPHVISDFESERLDFEDPEMYRDLSKPIGALNPKRLEDFLQRFESMPEADLEYGLPPPFLYGTHYSTPGYVLHYLVRVAPEYMFCLQNGKFDAPDRMFYSLKDTWESCLSNPTDLKELIPEFFCETGEFLKNSDDLDLGRRQTGDRVDNVDLPPWAKNPADFIRKNRKALESDYVSEHIHEWIDLIFGYKQKGEAAIEANNLYYYLTYEGSVDLEQEKDARRRAALEIQIQEFGQTPKQLFAMPHPARSDLSSPIELCQGININTSIENQVKKEDARRLELERSSGNHDEDLISDLVTLGDDFRAEVAEVEKLEESLHDEEHSSPKNSSASKGAAQNVMEDVPAPKISSRVGSIFSTITGKTASFFERTFGTSPNESGDSPSMKDDDSMGKLLTKEEAALIDAFRTSSASPIPPPAMKTNNATGAPNSTSTVTHVSSTKFDSAQSSSPLIVSTNVNESRLYESTTISSLDALHSYSAHSDAITGISGVYVNDENNAAHIPIGCLVICTCSNDTTMRMLHLKDGDTSLSLHREFSTGTDHAFSSCYLTNDATHALLGSYDQRVYSYSVTNACAAGKQALHDDAICSIAFVNDASNINSIYGTNLLLTGSFNGSVKLWRVLHSNLLSGQPAAEFQVHGNAIHKVALKYDVKLAAAGADDGKVIVWDIQTQLNVLTCKVGQISPVTGMEWMPNDKLVCCAKDGSIALIDVSPSALSSASFGFSTIVCSTQVDSEILCMQSIVEPSTLQSNTLQSVSSTSSSTILCGCNDGSIRIFSITEQTIDEASRIEEVYRFPRAHEAPVTSLAIVATKGTNTINTKDNDHYLLLSGGGNGSIRIWRIV